MNEDVSFDMWLGQYASPKYDQKYIKPRLVKKVWYNVIWECEEDNNVNEDVSFDMWLGQYASPKYN